MSIVPFTSEQSEPSERYYEHEKLKQFLMSWKRFSTFLPVEFQVLPTFLKIVVSLDFATFLNIVFLYDCGVERVFTMNLPD